MTYHSDRREGDQNLLDLLTSMNALHIKVDSLNEVKQDLIDLKGEVEQHIKETARSFEMAFPNKDLDGHRRLHEAQIKAAEDKAEFFHKMKIKAGEMTVYAFIFCLAAMVVYFWNGHMPDVAQINFPPK